MCIKSMFDFISIPGFSVFRFFSRFQCVPSLFQVLVCSVSIPGFSVFCPYSRFQCVLSLFQVSMCSVSIPGLSVFYFMVLLFVLFQNRRDVRSMLEWLYPDLVNMTHAEKVRWWVEKNDYCYFVEMGLNFMYLCTDRGYPMLWHLQRKVW